MAETISLKSGRQVTLIQDDDFGRMLEEELGRDAVNYFIIHYRRPLLNVESSIQKASEIIGDALEDVLSDIYDVDD